MTKFISTIIIFLIAVSCLHAGGKGADSNILIDKIYRDYAVKIVFETSAMIPKYWFMSPINGKALKLDVNYRCAALGAIASALKKYPKSFLEKNLHSIGLCGYLSFYNMEYGGTVVYERHSIILVVKDWTKPEWVDSTINHELNHLLVYWNDFPKDEWIKCNKKGFTYGDGGLEAIQNGKSNTDRNEASFSDGFACQYAKSDLYEDVATMAEYVITDGEDFYKRALKFPVIKKKYQIIKKFYHDLDGCFDEKFWMRNIDLILKPESQVDNRDDENDKKYSVNSDGIDKEGLPDEDDHTGDNEDGFLH